MKLIVETWQTERGWSAREKYGFSIEAEGGQSEEDAVDAVYGAALCAIGQWEHPPRNIACEVRPRDGGEIKDRSS